jgi:hypothetical protein
MKKVKIHSFWIPTENSTGTSRYRNFVAKADYDRATDHIKELESIIKHEKKTSDQS